MILTPIIIHQTPILECGNKRKERQFWQGFVIKKDDGHFYYSLSWHEVVSGEWSARTPSVPTRCTGKNLGRSNETSDEEQSIFEISVLERKKREKGYHEEGQKSIVAFPLPMLAHTYFDGTTGEGKVKKGHRTKIKFPCLVQPKLDGFRCMTDGDIAWSRTAKQWKLEIFAPLRWDTNGAVPDGELMLPPNEDFEMLATAVAGSDKKLTAKLEHHIYDLLPDGVNILEDTTFEKRYAYLEALFASAKPPANVHLVKAVWCESPEELEELLLPKALKMGYEGVMARNSDGVYSLKHRSYDLQKVKLFMEDEFEITDCLDGKGSDEEALMYRCVTKEGVTFRVRPKGRIPIRKRLWERWVAGTFNPIGKMLTVEFFQYTAKGAPRFGKAKAIRDYE